MQFVIKQDPAHKKDLSHFIRSSELSAIRVMESHAVRAATLPQSHELRLSMKHHTSSADSPEGHQLIHVFLEVEAIAGEPDERLMEVKVVFELEYALNEGYRPTPDHIEAFMEGNAVLHCWPYFREFVQSSTQRMGLTVPPLPMIGVEAETKPAAVKQSRKQPARKRG
jgi:hypothetical protein